MDIHRWPPTCLLVPGSNGLPVRPGFRCAFLVPVFPLSWFLFFAQYSAQDREEERAQTVQDMRELSNAASGGETANKASEVLPTTTSQSEKLPSENAKSDALSTLTAHPSSTVKAEPSPKTPTPTKGKDTAVKSPPEKKAKADFAPVKQELNLMTPTKVQATAAKSPPVKKAKADFAPVKQELNLMTPTKVQATAAKSPPAKKAKAEYAPVKKELTGTLDFYLFHCFNPFNPFNLHSQ